MKILRIIFLLILIEIMPIVNINKNYMYAYADVNSEKPIKAAVVLYSFDDLFISLVKQDLEEIQKNHSNNIVFTFYDSKKNLTVQDKIINSILTDNFDIVLANLVNLNSKSIDSIIHEFKHRNIPLILFNVAPFVTDSIKSYEKALVIATDAAQSGVFQGQILVNQWNSNKKSIDFNNDNMLQYIILTGPQDNKLAIDRTKSVISTLHSSGIQTQELGSKSCEWDRQCAKNATEDFFKKYGNKIEAIISNNDDMAIGAIEVLQKYGYNKGNKTRTIPVIGIDAVPEAQNLISKGFMTGTVIQDPYAMAESLYKVSLNMVNNKHPLYDTNYKFNETGVVIELPYYQYTKDNN